MREAKKYITGTILVLAGMVGIYFKVEYSGWVIFLGALILL
jgi:hypothetical protein